jgi:hypothetical protein
MKRNIYSNKKRPVRYILSVRFGLMISFLFLAFSAEAKDTFYELPQTELFQDEEVSEELASEEADVEKNSQDLIAQKNTAPSPLEPI